jgi:cyclohexyl-isocyanide hydratase
VLVTEPTDERVVWDRNRVTGGGLTAGIDFALALEAKLMYDTYAMSVQLVMEFAPAPSIKAGKPREAGAETINHVREKFAPFAKSETLAAEKAKSRW